MTFTPQQMYYWHVQIKDDKMDGTCGASTTLTEVFPCFFLSCKTNARVTLAKTGYGPHCSIVVICVVLSCCLCCSLVVICVVLALFLLFCCYWVVLLLLGCTVVICVVLLLFVLFYILFVCKCVLYHCHQVFTQLQLTNISHHII